MRSTWDDVGRQAVSRFDGDTLCDSAAGDFEDEDFASWATAATEKEPRKIANAAVDALSLISQSVHPAQ